MDKCVSHPRVRARGACSDCGDFLCPECVHFEVKHKLFCAACAFRAKQFGDVEVPPDLRQFYPEYSNNMTPSLELMPAAESTDAGPPEEPPSVTAPSPRARKQKKEKKKKKPKVWRKPPKVRAPKPAKREALRGTSSTTVLPILILVVLAGAYMGLQAWQMSVATPDVQALPAREVIGDRSFRECQQNLQAALVALESGLMAIPSCPYSNAAYRVKRGGDGTITIQCPDSMIHGVHALFIDSKIRIALVTR